MNIRFVAVDASGHEIETDDDNDHPPITHLDSSAIPRVGEQIMFYNIGNHRDAKWTVTDVIWMIGAYRSVAPHDAAAHVCVMIRRNEDET